VSEAGPAPAPAGAASCLRRGLDLLYDGAGVLGALFLALILVIVLAQIVFRLLDIALPGATDYAGYCMAAASFLGLAHTFRHGAHIRVELILQSFSGTRRRVAEVVALLVASGLAWYFCVFAIKAVRVSRLIHDISQGQDATPLWIPQLAMAAGTLVFAIALTDRLVSVLRGASLERPAETPLQQE
jgi:TRAP-type C4-dicarboxylate transport system permease small subunit